MNSKKNSEEKITLEEIVEIEQILKREQDTKLAIYKIYILGKGKNNKKK